LQTELRERERAEARVRQLNTRLEERVVQRTRELEAAHQGLEETTILELIAQNAPLTEICGRLASLLAVRTNAFVSINIAAAGRHSGLVAVLLYDLDRFKDVNDTLGHDVGDRVLRHVAAQLETEWSVSAAIARLSATMHHPHRSAVMRYHP
jgi:GGDEF domain-containing protein